MYALAVVVDQIICLSPKKKNQIICWFKVLCERIKEHICMHCGYVYFCQLDPLTGWTQSPRQEYNIYHLWSPPSLPVPTLPTFLY